MRDLDETDLEILRLLAEDARRSWRDIGEAVGLSGPAVSDRVGRLREAGIIRGFTVDLDRSQLRAGVPVLVQASLEGDTGELRARLEADDAVEHVFVTAAGDVWFSARAESQRVGRWLDGLLGPEVSDHEVTLLDAVDWTPSVDGTSFALTCAECGNTVDSEGETARLDGEIYHFCCASCRTRFAERFERFEADA